MSSLFFRRPSDVRAEEEQGMEHLVEIQNTLKELRKSTYEVEKQMLINQFLIHLDSFILLASTKSITNANFNSICKEMLEYSSLIDNNAAITLQYMKVLTKAYGISQFSLNCRKYCNILISVCKISNHSHRIFSKHSFANRILYLTFHPHPVLNTFFRIFLSILITNKRQSMLIHYYSIKISDHNIKMSIISISFNLPL